MLSSGLAVSEKGPWFLLEDRNDSNKRGIPIAKSGLSVGKHTATTPIVSSKNENVAAPTLSHVGSADTAAACSVRIR